MKKIITITNTILPETITLIAMAPIPTVSQVTTSVMTLIGYILTTKAYYYANLVYVEIHDWTADFYSSMTSISFSDFAATAKVAIQETVGNLTATNEDSILTDNYYRLRLARLEGLVMLTTVLFAAAIIAPKLWWIVYHTTYYCWALFTWMKQRKDTYSGLIREAIIDGSTLIGSKVTPKFQATVKAMGGYKTHGQAVRIADYLVTPYHVLSSVSTESDFVTITGKQGSIDLSIADFVEVYTDVAAIRLDEKLFSKAGLGVPKLSRSIEGTCTVTALGKTATGSFCDGRVLGHINVTASTEKGFSGAAYVQMGTLLGMHQGAEKDVNVGVSATMINALLQKTRMDKYSPEATGGETTEPPEIRALQRSGARRRTFIDTTLERQLDGTWTTTNPNSGKIDFTDRTEPGDDFYNQKLVFDDESAKVDERDKIIMDLITEIEKLKKPVPKPREKPKVDELDSEQMRTRLERLRAFQNMEQESIDVPTSYTDIPVNTKPAPLNSKRPAVRSAGSKNYSSLVGTSQSSAEQVIQTAMSGSGRLSQKEKRQLLWAINSHRGIGQQS